MGVIEMVEPIISGFVANPGQIGLALGLLAAGLYWRKVTTAAGLLSTVIGKIVVSVVVIGLLLLAGVIPRVNVDQAMALAAETWQVLGELVQAVMGELT